jgi:hypothetical protein
MAENSIGTTVSNKTLNIICKLIITIKWTFHNFWTI